MCDFTQPSSIRYYVDEIAPKLAKLDVGFLVVNAAYTVSGPVHTLEHEELEHVVNAIALHKIYLTKILISQMLERFETTGVKGAIVATTSVAAKRVCAGFVPYSACKSFVSHFFEGISFELQGKIDVMSYIPGEVATKMIFKKN